MLEYSVIIFLVGLLGGVVPLVVRRSDRLLHLFIAFATGIFLGVVFLHLLPEVAALAAVGAEPEPGHEGHAHGGGAGQFLWFFVLVGVVGLFLLQNLVFSRGGSGARHQHAVVGWASFLGLCIHAFTAGLTLATASKINPELGYAVYIGIVSHKIAETFSLSTVFLLAGYRNRRILVFATMLALVTPLGAFAGDQLVVLLSEGGIHILTALAAGTFLFVALCDLLPEVFHHGEDRMMRVGSLAVGILFSVLMHQSDLPIGTFLLDFLLATWHLVCDTAPFLLLGFFLAGLLKVFVPPELIYKHLGGRKLRSVLLASLYGVPVPLCSCSVIPTAASLREAGAGKGATAAFLISTPETGVDSISVTYALLDPIMTVIRPVVAFFTAVATGVSVNAFAGEEEEAPAPPPEATKPCCCAPEPAMVSIDIAPPKPPLGAKLTEAWRYSFGKLFDDLTRLLLVGFLLAGLIAVLVPETLFTEHVPSGWPSMLLMLVAGIPLYICATASTPIAATLIAKGLDPGAALVFLLVGPATNITTILVVGRMLGRRTLVIYLVCLAVLAVVAGIGTNLLYSTLEIDLPQVVAASMHGGPSEVGIIGGAIFLLLMAISAKRIGLGTSLLRLNRSDDHAE